MGCVGVVPSRLAALDARLVDLIARYHASLEAEREATWRHVGREERRRRLEATTAERALYLSLLGAHAARLTNGAVTLATATEAETQRCSRAVAESVARPHPGCEGSLSSSARGSEDGCVNDVRVVDVRRVWNPWVAAAFDACGAAVADPEKRCQVRGLFCVLPHGSLARVVGFGEADPEASKAEKKAERKASTGRTAFDRSTSSRWIRRSNRSAMTDLRCARVLPVTIRAGAHPVTPDAAEAVFPTPWKTDATLESATALAAASRHDSAIFIRRATAASATVPLPLELTRHVSAEALLRAATRSEDAADVAADVAAEVRRAFGEERRSDASGDVGGDGERTSEEGPPQTWPVHLALCRVVTEGGPPEGGAPEGARRPSEGRLIPARFEPERNAYLAHDAAAVLPEFIITVNVAPPADKPEPSSALEEAEEEREREVASRPGDADVATDVETARRGGAATFARVGREFRAAMGDIGRLTAASAGAALAAGEMDRASLERALGAARSRLAREKERTAAMRGQLDVLDDMRRRRRARRAADDAASDDDDAGEDAADDDDAMRAVALARALGRADAARRPRG